LIYLILWLFIPQANTATEKLNMYGRAVTLENIGKTVTDGFERVGSDINDDVRSDRTRTRMQRVGDGLVEVIGFCLKIFLIILAIVCSPILFAFALGFVLLIIGAIIAAITGTAGFVSMFPIFGSIVPPTVVGFLLSGTGLVMVGIPLFAIVFTILSYVFSWRPMSTGLKWALVILWILSTIGFFLCCLTDPIMGFATL
jgi:MFS family permease